MDVGALFQQLAAQYGYFGVFLASILGNATIIFPLPAIALVYALGSVFDPFWLGVSAGVGASIGELTAYFVGYGVFAMAGNKYRESRAYKAASGMLKKYGMGAIFLFAATPLPMDVIGMVAGFQRYNLLAFFLAMLPGKLIKMWMVAYAGKYSFGIVLALFENAYLDYGMLAFIIIIGYFIYKKFENELK
ncbi:hypothetical protein AUJ13_03190 [Candidatus Micrarchaeota archaeon CG1_02_49_24]|nr:MAG: hypothetical protein AUJ13_03190 [Candidatus Micrarchaeota archaeon CG1_02_49_24]HII53842.1 VTT domain-containing protein [Candidatus Micrarchaeota archaeon]